MPDEPVTEIQPHDQVLLVLVRKRSLNETSSQELVDDVLAEASTRPGVPIVLDLSLLRFVPSVALARLVRLSKSLRLEGRRLALIRVDRRVLDVIHVTNLHAVLEIHDTLEQVIDVPPNVS